jgi:hypothetical protein
MVTHEPQQDPVYDCMRPIRLLLDNLPQSNDNAKVDHSAQKSKEYLIIDGT